MKTLFCHNLGSFGKLGADGLKSLFMSIFDGRRFLACCLLILSCKQEQERELNNITYTYEEPAYDQVELLATNDTLHFSLVEEMYNYVQSFNTFSQYGKVYIAFHDKRSQFIGVYDFSTRQLTKKIDLKTYFGDLKLYKTSVFVENFDSIFVNNTAALYLLDGTGKVRKKIDFLEKPSTMMAVFNNITSPVLRGEKLYAGVRLPLREESSEARKTFRVLYEFDLKKDKASLRRSFPSIYKSRSKGDYFLDYSYCYNDKGNFVLSFSADSSIYETNLDDYNYAYYGKSRFHRDAITPISKASLSSEEMSKEYAVRDMYGGVYYDRVNKRYLRFARQKVAEPDYEAGKRNRKSSIIIFNENFKIIGESQIDGEISFNGLFFSPDGGIYVRTKLKDEYAIHFVRLQYSEKK